MKVKVIKNTYNYEPKPYLVAFIDALGFSAEVGRSPSRKLNYYLQTLDQARTNWEHLQGKGQIKLQLIGDSIVLIQECPGVIVENVLRSNEPNFINLFWNFAFGVAEIQNELAQQDIWTRGAIVYDLLYHSLRQTAIVGPAFLRAYALEREFAKYPRVVVDGRIIEAAGFQSGREFVRAVNATSSEQPVLFEYTDVPRPYQKLFAQDVPTFVNFLALQKSFGIEQRTALLKLGAHISRNFRKDVRHFEKYKWLADYLITFILGDSGYTDDLEIQRLLILMQYC